MAVKNTTSEQEFLIQIEKHKGILFKFLKCTWIMRKTKGIYFRKLFIKPGNHSPISVAKVNLECGFRGFL